MAAKIMPETQAQIGNKDAASRFGCSTVRVGDNGEQHRIADSQLSSEAKLNGCITKFRKPAPNGTVYVAVFAMRQNRVATASESG
jgi:hypothetical protein